ncbi:ABC transporter ATP-binding protein [Ottowia testudinis]|uniref:ABC transporter ATP-binding protein n=1 Tax=Ottowia testudinis TaxID=2816950 RepID=A0A975H667_9BURK|nr:ABC transporter ATP-binding protein [Ottowia testudinis]QTD45692.1 ABC transporter ATP-binding protein [Ottowia testudinis]
MAFLSLHSVSKFYGSSCAVSALSLDVAQGEFVSLLGPSGCGKTTTLQMVAGFVPVSSGRIMLAGRDITHASPESRGLGIVFQSYALFPHMTVAQNVSFGLEMRKVAPAERQERARRILSLVHLDAYAARYPRELSGGQRQRVALARALVIEPPVLLLDEPLSNLDAKLRADMQLELRQIQRKVGTTTVMVTHDQSEALSVSDRVVVMDGGVVRQMGAPLDVYEHPGTRFVSTFVGHANLVDARVFICPATGRPRVALGSLELDLTDADLGASAAASATSGTALVSIRPEKITLRPRGSAHVDAQVQERFFLGSQWLYRLKSDVGDWIVTRPNDGHALFEPGEWAALDWPAHCLRVLPADEAVVASAETGA